MSGGKNIAQFHSKNNLHLRAKVGMRSRYRPRHMSQAMKPETFKPMTSATALLWPIDESCRCYACSGNGKDAQAGQRGGFSRAYVHHLERCGEMLAPMLATIHNLHYYLDLMREVREALDGGRFGAFVAQFRQERARGV